MSPDLENAAVETASRDQLVAQVSQAYRGCHPRHKYYVRAKLKTDPLSAELYDWLVDAGPLGRVLDAGCGRGQFALLAALGGEWSSLQGFDLDEDKVSAASLAATQLSETGELAATEFHSGDLRSFEFPEANTVFAFDVLHYLSGDDQKALVARLAHCLAPGGRLLIRETNQEGGLGASLAAGFERVGKWLGINRGVTLEFREPGALEEELRACGLEVEKRSPRGALQNVLLIATRRA